MLSRPSTPKQLHPLARETLSRSQKRHQQALLSGYHPQPLQESTVADATLQALSLHSQTDDQTLASALKWCGQRKALREGRLVHAHIVRTRQTQSRFLINWLVRMYGDCETLDEAQAVFDTLPNPNLYSWTVLINAYSKNGHAREALICYDMLRRQGLMPNCVTFVCVVDACATLAAPALDKGKQIHAAIQASRLEGYVNLATALVNMYGKCGSLRDATIVFDRMPRRDVVTWNAMICAYAHNGKGKEALECFHRMQLRGFKPSPVTFVCALDACAGLTCLEKGKELHTLMGCGYEGQVFVGTALINMYGKCGSANSARIVFDRMRSRNVATWNAMIAAYALNGHDKEALDCYNEMQTQRVKPDQVTFVSVLSACSHTGVAADARHYFLSMIHDYGITPLLGHCVCLIDTLSRAGHLDDAEALVVIMPFKTEVVLWLCLLHGCKIHNDVDRGLRITNHIFKLDPTIDAAYVLLSSIFAAGDECEPTQSSKLALSI